jgi:hypothetical protein
MAKKGLRGASLNPDDAGAGGLTLDDVDAVIEECRFVDDFDYAGKVSPMPLSLKVTFSGETFEPQTQHFSAGSLDRFEPSKDGLCAVPAEGQDDDILLIKTTNALLFITSLVDSGFPKDKIADEVDIFEGTSVHVRQVPRPKLRGIDREGDAQKTILAVTKIHALPWEKKKGGSKAKGKATGKAKAKAEPEEASADISEKAAEFVMSAVTASENGILKKDLLVEVFKAMAKDGDRADVVKLIKTDEFLAEGPWTYDEETETIS